MNAFVANTDRDWFDFLSAREDVDEVNFWQPSAGGVTWSVSTTRALVASTHSARYSPTRAVVVDSVGRGAV